jgi:hypothetical protein
MNKHPFLRAYLAGIAVPTVFLLLIMTAYTFIRYVFDVPVPVERVIVFPMAAVPNAWGLWNVLYLAFAQRRHFSLGLFGGALPLLLAPSGYGVTRLLSFNVPTYVLEIAPFALPIGMIVYYLVWKYFVGFLNAELGIA